MPKKQINLVWVGNGTINPLGAFNILGWVCCGWSVTLYRHGSRIRNWRDMIHPSLRDHFAKVQDAPFTVVPLVDALLTNGAGMPKTRSILMSWLNVPLEGYVGYAIADTAKSFIAGTTHGIVIDTKIGPSPYIHTFPEEVFETEFVSASRLGGMSGGVENQIAGSFNAEKRRLYGLGFDQWASRLTTSCGDEGLTPSTAEFVFGAATANHVMGFNKAKGKNLSTYSHTGQNFEFDELRGSFAGSYEIPDAETEKTLLQGKGAWGGAQKSRGPFRVYQVAGFFNWRQGFPEQRKNAVAVAYTLMAEHANEPPPPFDSNPDYYKALIQPMVPEVVRSLLASNLLG